LTTLQRGLRDRSIELAIWRAQTLNSDEDMLSEVLCNDRPLVVAGPKNKWARQQRIKLADLLEEPWILPPSDSVPATLIQDTFPFACLNVPRTCVSSASMPVTMYLLAAGRFLTMLPDSMLRFSAKYTSLKVLPVKLPASPRLVTVVSLKHRTLSPAAKLFIEYARDVAKSLTKGREVRRNGVATCRRKTHVWTWTLAVYHPAMSAHMSAFRIKRSGEFMNKRVATTIRYSLLPGYGSVANRSRPVGRKVLRSKVRISMVPPISI